MITTIVLCSWRRRTLSDFPEIVITSNCVAFVSNGNSETRLPFAGNCSMAVPWPCHPQLTPSHTSAELNLVEVPLSLAKCTEIGYTTLNFRNDVGHYLSVLHSAVRKPRHCFFRPFTLSLPSPSSFNPLCLKLKICTRRFCPKMQLYCRDSADQNTACLLVWILVICVVLVSVICCCCQDTKSLWIKTMMLAVNLVFCIIGGVLFVHHNEYCMSGGKLSFPCLLLVFTHVRARRKSRSKVKKKSRQI